MGLYETMILYDLLFDGLTCVLFVRYSLAIHFALELSVQFIIDVNKLLQIFKA